VAIAVHRRGEINWALYLSQRLYALVKEFDSKQGNEFKGACLISYLVEESCKNLPELVQPKPKKRKDQGQVG